MSGGFDSLEAYDAAYSTASYRTPEQIAEEARIKAEQERLAAAYVNGRHPTEGLGPVDAAAMVERRDEILQMLGLIPTPVAAVFPGCDHPQTEENTVTSSRGSGRYCKRCKNRPEPKVRVA